jgi:hypothetical protein
MSAKKRNDNRDKGVTVNDTKGMKIQNKRRSTKMGKGAPRKTVKRLKRNR